MPTVSGANVVSITADILVNRRLPREDAVWIASLLVKAHLHGHHTHGLGFLQHYITCLDQGKVNPKPKVKIIKENETMAVLDGDLGMGQVVAKEAVEVLLRKTETQSVAAVTFRNSSHVARLADYTIMGAEKNIATLFWVNSTYPCVAPYGGAEARLGTNPFCIAIPGRKDYAMCFDIASASISVGELFNSHRKSMSIQPGLVIDNLGNSTTNPITPFVEPRGAILPFGEHRGYGLSLVSEILGGVISGSGLGDLNQEPPLNGGLMIGIKVSDFLPIETYYRMLETLTLNLKQTRPAPGFKEVHIPGERSREFYKNRKDDKFEIDENLWSYIQSLRK